MEIETDFAMDLHTKRQESLRKYKVVVYHEEGMSYLEIEKETGYKKGTISKILDKFRNYGDVNFNCYSSNYGRHSALDTQDKALVIDALTKDNTTTLQDLQQKIFENSGKGVSIWPIN